MTEIGERGQPESQELPTLTEELARVMEASRRIEHLDSAKDYVDRYEADSAKLSPASSTATTAPPVSPCRPPHTASLQKHLWFSDPGLEGEYQARAAERSWASDLQWVALRVSPEGEARPARHRGVVHKRRRSCPQPCWPLLCYSLLPPCHPPGAAGMLRVCTPGVPAQQQPS